MMTDRRSPAARGRTPSSRSRAKRSVRLRRTIVASVALLGLLALAISAIDTGSTLTPLQSRIITVADSQLGYHTDPSDSYCNKFSAYWGSGLDECSGQNTSEEWCADFAAWVWKKAGAVVTYEFHYGDLNSQSASFYVWGLDHDTWHSVVSGYIPQPGDVAVYGLDLATLTAQHVAIVTSYQPGARGPNVVNGDGTRTGFSVVEAGTDQFKADVHGQGGEISGYVSPTSPS
jgi:hypothetical protein